VADLLELLVNEYKLNINHLDGTGFTPLIFAIKMQKDEAIIKKLLELGADASSFLKNLFFNFFLF